MLHKYICKFVLIVVQEFTLVHRNFEQNVYSNQKEELDNSLNHSEHSIFIEYLYTVMIYRQKKGQKQTYKWRMKKIQRVILHFVSKMIQIPSLGFI